MSLRKGIPILIGLVFVSGNLFASAGVRRYALAVGSNYGAPDRPTLRYAVSDAQNFSRVLETLGGVDRSDLVLLTQPTLGELEDAMEAIRQRVDASPEEERSQVLVYFSGHANETGLLLGEEVFSYRSLRNWMDLLNADVRIAVLDACASGAITRLKGSRRRKAFLVDISSDMRGHAFLTSSSADEVAQESDRIGASFFTHYLVSGLRGAADVSGEGMVTLNEAYQFAFNETLGRTTETQAGAQHPSYDINLSGTGEVVMTDIRETSAVLVLDEDLGGRFFVRNSNQQLVVELFKLRGRRVELGLEPGTYSVRCESESGSSLSAATLEEDRPFVLGPQNFTAAEQEPVVARGGGGVRPRFGGFDRRWSVGARLGSWYFGGLGGPQSDYLWDSRSTTGGVAFSYWLSENWSVDFTAWTLMRLVAAQHPTPGNDYIAAFLFGGKRYLPNIGGARRNIRPFLAAAVGPYVRSAQVVTGNESVAVDEGPPGPTELVLPTGPVARSVAAGGRVGGGFDFQLNRWSMVETMLGYNFTADFERDQTGTFGQKTSYNGFQLAIGFSFLWGKGRAPE